MRRVSLLACGLALALPSSALAAPLVPAAAGGVEDLGVEGDNKWPSVAVFGGVVHVGWGSKEAVNVWSRPEEQGPFAPLGASPGVVGDNPTFFNVRLAGAPDGTLHALWIDGSVENARLVRHRAFAGGAWSETHDVSPAVEFLNGARIVVRPSGEIFAVWSAPCPAGKNLIFSTSSDAGATWAPTQCVEMPVETYGGGSSVSAAPGGDVHLAYFDGAIRHSVWNGTSFTSETVTAAEDFFDATVSVGPDGRAALGFRKVGQGAFWAQQGDSGYTVEPFPASGAVVGPVPVVVDTAGNVHAAWIASSGRSEEIWYAVKAPDEPFSAPLLAVPADGGFRSNLDLAATIAEDGAARAHLVWEGWPVMIVVRYQQVRTPCAACPATCDGGSCPPGGDESSGTGTSGAATSTGDGDTDPQSPTEGPTGAGGSSGVTNTGGTTGATGATGDPDLGGESAGCNCESTGDTDGAWIMGIALVPIFVRVRRTRR